MKTVAMWAVGVAVAASLGGSASQAQPKGESRSAMLQKLVDCRKLTDESQRLACYDQATVALDQAEAKGDIVVVDREQARTVRRQTFGFSMPSMALFERGVAPEEMDNITGVAKRAYQADGKWVIELEDGAVWQQTDSEVVGRRPRAGSKVEIRKASLGSYFMNLDGQRAVRAKRVQ